MFDPKLVYTFPDVVSDDQGVIVDSILKDPTKKDRVEVQLAKRFRSLDKEGIFLTELHDSLLKCEGIQIVKSRGRKMSKAFPKQMRKLGIQEDQFLQISLATLIIEGILDPLINNLYNLNNQTLAIKMIDEIVYMAKDKHLIRKYDTFLGFLIQHIYYNSMRYFMVSTAPQAIQQFVFTLGLSKKPEILSYQTLEEGEIKHEQCQFALDEQEFTCEYVRKTVNKRYNAIVQISSISGEILSRFNLTLPKNHPANEYAEIFD